MTALDDLSFLRTFVCIVDEHSEGRPLYALWELERYIEGPCQEPQSQKRGGRLQSRQNFGKYFCFSTDYSASLVAFASALILELHPAGLEPATL